MKNNNLSYVLTEFNQRYKYCFEELEKHYQECSTSDCKNDEDMRKYWFEKADTLDKIIRELKFCMHDAQYMADSYKEKIDKQDLTD